LRNVALRHSFFHNGVFHTLKEVLGFYAERDTNAEKWYRRNADGTVRKFDDLPAGYHANINIEPPFDRHAGDELVLSAQEIDDIIAFLQTLTDGDLDGKRQPKVSRAGG
jgi:cytochrome c peroxidase